jgi:phosphatidylserine decarboxylase
VRIAPEGWPFIATAWTLAAGAGLVAVRWGGAWWILPLLLGILAIWVVAFFRDPIRPGPRGDRYVLAAAEGKVLQVI